MEASAALRPNKREIDPNFVDVTSFVEMADFTGVGPRLMRETPCHQRDLPRTLEVYLAFLGLREWRPVASASFDSSAVCHPRSSLRRRLAKGYLWTIRILVIAVCLYTAFSRVRLHLSPDFGLMYSRDRSIGILFFRNLPTYFRHFFPRCLYSHLHINILLCLFFLYTYTFSINLLYLVPLPSYYHFDRPYFTRSLISW